MGEYPFKNLKGLTMSNMHPFFSKFRQKVSADDPLPGLRQGIVGKDALVHGPFGVKPMLYADYVASGRALKQVEDAILEDVLPYYANSHTEASYCGAYVTELRRAARAEIAHLCGADDAHAVIFTASGATAGINRLVHLFGLRTAIADGRGATVIHGPYEHHSNILPWRESGAHIVEIPEAAQGGPDLAVLDQVLVEAKQRHPNGVIVGTFSAASNVTGILTDVAEVTKRLKATNALAVWDYAGGGPYLPIMMSPSSDTQIDALVISPHKFAGGPAASGLLVLRKDAVSTEVPTFPGGGTVRYVSSTAHDYLTDISEREEAGTPNVVGDIRAALALIVKDVVGQQRIDQIDHSFAKRMLERLSSNPRLNVLGNLSCSRLPIFSLMIEDGPNGPIHPQYATRLLSDYHGIQVRGGCACAGPYGHHLLSIDDTTSAYLRDRILAGDVTQKPGFVRFNLSYLFTEEEFERIATAINGLPNLADQHLDLYRYDPTNGTYSSAVAA